MTLKHGSRKYVQVLMGLSTLYTNLDIASIQNLVQSPSSSDRNGSISYVIVSSTDSSADSPKLSSSFANLKDIGGHIEKLLECPVCFDVMIPPILSCARGHSCCNFCRENLSRCPICRGEFTEVRNLIAEQLLEKYSVKCKYDCHISLPATHLAEHYRSQCLFRPVYCRECDVLVPYNEYLRHVELVDKLEKQNASECSTGFEIDDEDIITGSEPNPGQHHLSGTGRRFTVWEPTWLYCYSCNYFCSLDYNGEMWWIWVSCLEERGLENKCQIILWSKEKESEHTYFGPVHPIRSNAHEVLESGSCLILTDSTLKKFMNMGGIDVLVRIETSYSIPKTRRGGDVQSPLEITTTTCRQSLSQPGGTNSGSNVTPVPRFSRPSSARTESRIPVAVSTPTVSNAGSARPATVGRGVSVSPNNTNESARRMLFGNTVNQRLQRPMNRGTRGRGGPSRTNQSDGTSNNNGRWINMQNEQEPEPSPLFIVGRQQSP